MTALVEVGATAPALVRAFDRADMVAYAGATWDWHRLHHDTTYLAARQLPAPVVDGQVFGALLAEQIQDWLGARAFIRRLHFRFRSLVFAGETVRCETTVTGVHDGTLTVDCRVVVPADGDSPERVVVAPAGAEVLLRPLADEARP